MKVKNNFALFFTLRNINIMINNPKFDVGGVMVCVLASSAVYRGFEPRSGQANYYAIGICCFSANHAALRRMRKDWL